MNFALTIMHGLKLLGTFDMAPVWIKCHQRDNHGKSVIVNQIYEKELLG